MDEKLQSHSRRLEHSTRRPRESRERAPSFRKRESARLSRKSSLFLIPTSINPTSPPMSNENHPQEPTPLTINIDGMAHPIPVPANRRLLRPIPTHPRPFHRRHHHNLRPRRSTTNLPELAATRILPFDSLCPPVARGGRCGFPQPRRDA